jgi:hypothetical protein
MWRTRATKCGTKFAKKAPAKLARQGAAGGRPVEWMRRFMHDVPLPDTDSLERDLAEAFQRKVSFKDRIEWQAWARLLAEKHDPEVTAVIGDAVKERSDAWYTGT